MIEVQPHKIELIAGYTDNTRDRKTHRSVTFGKLLTGKMLFVIDADPASSIPTQYQAMILRACITEFGTLRMPVPLTALLSLDTIDMDDLNAAFDRFSKINRGEKEAEIIDKNTVRLAVGYERNGLVYDVVTFGNRLTVMDEVEADNLKLADLKRVCFLAGKQVSRISQSEGQSVLDGPLPLEIFEELVGFDIQTLRVASEVYRQSFRLPGSGKPQVGADAQRTPAG